MDEKTLEQAEGLTESQIASAIAKARIKQERPAGFDGTCTDCEIEEVPPARVALGYYNCVYCQERKERHRRG